ncbi:Sal-like protein 4 [Plecturocebus cupreus]
MEPRCSQTSHLLSQVLPQTPGSVLFQSPFSMVVLGPSKKGKRKPLNITADGKPGDEVVLHKHACGAVSLPCLSEPSQPVPKWKLAARWWDPQHCPQDGPSVSSPAMLSTMAAHRWEEPPACWPSSESRVDSHWREVSHTPPLRARFATEVNLKVHYMIHGANSNSAGHGRELALENTIALPRTDGKCLRNVSQGNPGPFGDCRPCGVETGQQHAQRQPGCGHQ